MQNETLNQLRTDKTLVNIYLINGTKLFGKIDWFDNFSVGLRKDGITQIVFKHAMLTISPIIRG